MDIPSFRTMTFLGPHVTWADFPKDTPTVVDTWRCLPFAVVFLLLRELSDITLRPVLFKMVEMSNSSTSRKERFGLNAITKSSEAAFHLILHSCSFVGTLIVLWNKPWLWDTAQCWVGWPQDTPRDVYWLYMVQLGYYVSQFVSIVVLNDHQHKDKTVMVVHHLITMFLLVGSFVSKCHRVGTLVLLVHDVGDPCVCLMKLLWETGWRRAAEGAAAVGLLVWILSRQIVYPGWILHSMMVESLANPAIGLDMGMWWFNNGFLGTLFLFHCWWTWLFAKVIFVKVTQGKIKKGSQKLDDTEPSSDEDEPEVKEAEDGGDGGQDGKVKIN